MDLDLVQQLQSNLDQTAEVEQKISQAIAAQKKQLDKLQEQGMELRNKIKEAMVAANIKHYENDILRITYVAPTKRRSVDAKKLKEDEPDIYEKYLKTSTVSDKINIKIKEDVLLG